MTRFISGPRGGYNLAYVRSVYTTRDSGGKWQYWAEFADGGRVEIYESVHRQLEDEREFLPGSGTLRELWVDEAGTVSYIESEIFGWCFDLENGFHRPLSIWQTQETEPVVVKDGDCWVALGEQRFESWDEVVEWARDLRARRKEQEAAAARRKEQEKEP